MSPAKHYNTQSSIVCSNQSVDQCFIDTKLCRRSTAICLAPLIKFEITEINIALCFAQLGCFTVTYLT